MANLIVKTRNTLRRVYSNFTPQQKKMAFILEFLLRFLVSAVPIYLIMYFDVDLFALESIEAEQIQFFLGLFGVEAAIHIITIGTRIVPALRINEIMTDIAIDSACTGYRSMFAFAGLVFAYPRVPMKKRLYGLLMGIPIIYAVNIARVVSTIMAAVWFGKGYIDVVHTILWREGLIFIILILWIIWLKKIK